MTAIEKEDDPWASYAFSTRMLHAGQAPDPTTGAVTVPISLSTTFVQESPGVHKGFEYSRTGNPTRQALEAQLASAERARFAVAFASGSAATSAIVHLLLSGDHVVSVDDVYGGTNRYFRRVATPGMNVSFSFVDVGVEEKLLGAIQDNTKMIWLETPTNPTLKVTDIRKVVEIAHARGILVVVDNTFMSPYNQNPLDFGVDLVVHSMTKYINGMSDVVMGCVMTNSEEHYERLRFMQNGMGGVPGIFECYLAMRGLKTLSLRMARHNENGLKVAQYLEKHDKVTKVNYPGLPSHPQHKIHAKQARGSSGMVTIFLKGGIEEAKRFLSGLTVFQLAESLGAVESLVEHPAIMTHASVPPEQRAELGIDDSLIRLSVGIEDVDDLIADLEDALAKV